MRRIFVGLTLLLSGIALSACNSGDRGTGGETTLFDIEVAVSPSGAGTISPSADSSYEEGETVRLSANPAEDYRFEGWAGDIEESESSVSVTVDRDYSLRAQFERKEYELAVTTEGAGSVEEQVVEDKRKDYKPGTVVELTAEAEEGYRFAEWRGDLLSTDNPARVTMDQPKEVTAVFKEETGEPGDALLTIHWITDTHINEEVDGNESHEDGRSGNKYFWDATRRLREYRDIVNEERPELAVHTGDILEREARGWGLFNEIWESIEVEKELTIGNHDLERDDSGQAHYESVVEELGYGDRPVVEGSRFNRSFSVTQREGQFSARIIMVDSNINPATGEHEVSISGWVSEGLVDWISREAAENSDDLVLIFMHHGPHDYGSGRFDFSSADNLEEGLEGVTGKPVSILFGHAHNQYSDDRVNTTLEEFTNLTTPGYLNRAAVDYESGWFSRIKVSAEGDIEFEGEGL